MRADEIRALVPTGASIAQPVATIIEAVRAGGDAELERLEAEFGAGTKAPFTASGGALADDVRAGLEVAIHNVRAVAEAGVDEDRLVTLPQGHSVKLRDVPVRRAAVYAPGGRNPYPSTVVMGVMTAQAAGVDEVYVVGAPHPVMVAAAELCGADAYFAVTGAQAVAALAYGTESIPKVDVIVGPGSLWVQEAKRQVSAVVGIDGFAGPSDLTVVATEGADLDALKADLAGQGEHGEGSLTVAVSDSQAILDALDAQHGVLVADMDEALAFVEELAPEHLQIAGEAAEALAPRIRSAGCLFVGSSSGTAFGDYVAGSNHVLPTEGAARFASGLNVRHFRRRMAEVRVGSAGAALAAAGVPIAEAEAFPAHAASMRLRQNPRP
ncbi:histidinol dehydrogenase [Solirubrobacter pauli]|uniref:Histidinol dehydrogenase n=1 Tax=Solirubrobacter pauli TaxID=166793 RepID=A0A660L158_9ACTN|nr:histidinol dehydrogenase [Solirubrobacter pauli]RKQ87677.1 histidinol dehydrogenase [Solirubrobacter pauli]